MLVTHRTWQHSIERVRRLLGAAPSGVQVAALPFRFRGGKLEVMLITSRETGRWVLPKGWPEAGESFHEAAGREALEEAGLHGAMSDVEIGRYYYGKSLKTGLERRCEVMVYPLAVTHVSNKWPEKGQRVRRWFEPRAAADAVREPDLGEIIAEFRPTA